MIRNKGKKGGLLYSRTCGFLYCSLASRNPEEPFDKGDGFADKSVTVLDPSAGTLTFLAECAKLAVTEFTSRYGEGGKENFIKEHILKNFYAFELMMAPYAVGHNKMSFCSKSLAINLRMMIDSNFISPTRLKWRNLQNKTSWNVLLI